MKGGLKIVIGKLAAERSDVPTWSGFAVNGYKPMTNDNRLKTDN